MWTCVGGWMLRWGECVGSCDRLLRNAFGEAGKWELNDELCLTLRCLTVLLNLWCALLFNLPCKVNVGSLFYILTIATHFPAGRLSPPHLPAPYHTYYQVSVFRLHLVWEFTGAWCVYVMLRYMQLLQGVLSETHKIISWWACSNTWKVS